MSRDPTRALNPAVTAGVIAVAMLAWVGLRNARDDLAAAAAPFRAVKGSFAAGQEARFRDLAGQAYATLRSDSFQQNLGLLASRYPTIYASRSQPEMPIGRVADLVALKRPGARYVSADVILSDEAGAGFDAVGFAAQGPGEGRYSDVVLGRDVLRLWESPDLVEKSCAIAVTAHEYAHTISPLPFVYEPAFTDTGEGEGQIKGRRDRSLPVASYLLGTVAQCTWLEQRGRIRPSEVAACIEVFGVASPNLARCGAFPGATLIAEHPDLPPKTPPL